LSTFFSKVFLIPSLFTFNFFTEDKKTIPDKSLFFDEKDKVLFLLFNNKNTLQENLNIINNLMLDPVDVKHSYNLVGNYSMVVLKFPEEFNNDYNNILLGKYSKLSEKFKKRFPETQDAFNSKNVKIGTEHTIYYHIFNKTEWLKNIWLTRLGLIELENTLELWDKPEVSDMEFDIKQIIK